jgi:hypothetical protein
MIQANVEEDREAIMARFMNDLDHDTTHIMKLHYYVELEEIVYMAVKVEKQLKRKDTIQRIQPLGPLTPWKTNLKANIKDDPSQPNEEGKAKYPREKNDTSTIVKGNNVTSTSHNRDIKCFLCLSFGHVASQYQNKRVMIMKANNKVETNGEDEEEKMPPLEDANDVCVEYPVEGEALVVRRELNMYVKVDDSGG